MEQPSRCHSYWIDGGKFITSLGDRESYVLRTSEGYVAYYLGKRLMTFNALTDALRHVRIKQKQAREQRKATRREAGLLPGSHRSKFA